MLGRQPEVSALVENDGKEWIFKKHEMCLLNETFGFLGYLKNTRSFIKKR